MKKEIEKLKNEIRVLKNKVEKDLYSKKDLIEKLINEKTQIHQDLFFCIRDSAFGIVPIEDLNEHACIHYCLCIEKHNGYRATICKYKDGYLKHCYLSDFIHSVKLDGLSDIIDTFDRIIIKLEEDRFYV